MELHGAHEEQWMVMVEGAGGTQLSQKKSLARHGPPEAAPPAESLPSPPKVGGWSSTSSFLCSLAHVSTVLYFFP